MTTLARELAEEIFYEYQQDAVMGDKVRVTKNGKTFYRARPGKGKKASVGGKGKKRGAGKALAIAGGLAATGALAAGGAYALSPNVRNKTNAVAGRVKQTASKIGEEVKGGGQDLKKTGNTFVRRSKKVAQRAGFGGAKGNEADVQGNGFVMKSSKSSQKPSANLKETFRSEGKVAGAAGKEVGRTIRNRSRNIGQILKEGAQGIGSEFQGSGEKKAKKKKGNKGRFNVAGSKEELDKLGKDLDDYLNDDPKKKLTGDSLEALNAAIAHIEDYKAGRPNYYIPRNYAYSR